MPLKNVLERVMFMYHAGHDREWGTVTSTTFSTGSSGAAPAPQLPSMGSKSCNVPNTSQAAPLGLVAASASEKVSLPCHRPAQR
ncbi:hypothetical protein PG985_007883 [Apiospora marii]